MQTQENDIVDAEIIDEPVDTETVESADESASTNTSIAHMMSALRAAVSSGNITSRDARKMRQELGVFQSNFTRKQTSKTKRKAKRKAQKVARRANWR